MKKADPRFLYENQDIIYQDPYTDTFYLGRIKKIGNISSVIQIKSSYKNAPAVLMEHIYYASPENKTEILLKGKKLIYHNIKFNEEE